MSEYRTWMITTVSGREYYAVNLTAEILSLLKQPGSLIRLDIWHDLDAVGFSNKANEIYLRSDKIESLEKLM